MIFKGEKGKSKFVKKDFMGSSHLSSRNADRIAQNSGDNRNIISNVWEIILQKSKLINIPHDFQRRKEKGKKI